MEGQEARGSGHGLEPRGSHGGTANLGGDHKRGRMPGLGPSLCHMELLPLRSILHLPASLFPHL